MTIFPPGSKGPPPRRAFTQFLSPHQRMATELRRVADTLSSAESSAPEDAFLVTIDVDGIVGVKWMLGPSDGRALLMVGVLELVKTQLLGGADAPAESAESAEGDAN